MNMAQGHIIKACCHQGIFLNRDMLLIAAMGKKNVKSRPVQRPHPVIQRRFNLPVLIAQAINPGVQRFNINGVHPLLAEEMDIFSPRKSPVI